MIIKILVQIVIGAIGLLLTPFSFVTNIFSNVFAETKFLSILKACTFFINKEILIFLISTFLFWASIFVIRPLVNFIRNRS